MIEYCSNEKELKNDEPFIISVEDQLYDEETLRQLRDEHNVIFMTGGNGVLPIMVLNERKNPLLAIGHEDDGTIFFDRKYGQYSNTLSPHWVDYLVSDLREAVRFIRRKSQKSYYDKEMNQDLIGKE